MKNVFITWLQNKRKLRWESRQYSASQMESPVKKKFSVFSWIQKEFFLYHELLELGQSMFVWFGFFIWRIEIEEEKFSPVKEVD